MSLDSLDEMDFDEMQSAQRTVILAEIDGLSPAELAKYANTDSLKRMYGGLSDENPGHLAD